MNDGKLSVSSISIVLPVRDRQDAVKVRVEQLLEGLAAITTLPAEIILVDDGSRDATAGVLTAIKAANTQVRIIRHKRPRGMEAAGQTGLECARGDIVFIQETDTDVRLEDLRCLIQISADLSVVAARTESLTQPVSPALVRRLRAWGTHADKQLEIRVDSPEARCSLQMVRRRHMQSLSSPGGKSIRLVGETRRTTRVENNT